MAKTTSYPSLGMIEHVHCFAFDCKKTNESVNDVTWILVNLLFVWAISPPLASDTDHLPTWDCSAEVRRLPASSISSTTAPFNRYTRLSGAALVFVYICFRGQGVCRWRCTNEVKLDISGNLVTVKKAAAPSHSLTALQQWSRWMWTRDNFSAHLQLMFIYRYTYDWSIYSF